MNSYNENLHSTVVASLQNEELDMKQVYSAANASMFALYYAQDATITAADKLKEAKSKQSAAEKRKKQAVDNSNISGNLLKSANQANKYLQQSITNTAVAASNVQIASNSIVRLASDLGSIYNIAQAADFDTDIFNKVKEANQLITESAYAAELASQFAMEASVLTAQVPGATLLDKAKSTNNSMNELLKIVASDYDSKSQLEATANATLAATSVKEKSAEGEYEDIETMSRATGVAYSSLNKELNLGLKAKAVWEDKRAGIQPYQSTYFNVTFNWIKSPFKETDKRILYPVQHYYIIVVKDKQKTTFSIHNAEDIIKNHTDRFIYLDNIIQPASAQNPKPVASKFNHNFNYLDLTNAKGETYELKDSDGNKMVTGVNYTVFIMAAYYEEYKKNLNTFDDFLSAPSLPFCLTHQLVFATEVTQTTVPVGEPGSTVITDKPINAVSFSVAENPDYTGKIQYRCMLLPLTETLGVLKSNIAESNSIKTGMVNSKLVSENLVAGMVNSQTIEQLDIAIKELQEISGKIDPEIVLLNADLLSSQSNISLAIENDKTLNLGILQQEINANEKDINDSISDYVQLIKPVKDAYLFEMIAYETIEQTAKEILRGLIKNASTLSDLLKEMNVDPVKSKQLEDFIILNLQQFIIDCKLDILLAEKAYIFSKINEQHGRKIDFFFNLVIAEQVPFSNYTPAVLAKPLSVSTDQDSATDPLLIKEWPVVKWQASFDDTTTDNFGNLLAPGGYIPVIVSVYAGEEDNATSFTNSWTGYGTNQYFVFQQPQ